MLRGLRAWQAEWLEVLVPLVWSWFGPAPGWAILLIILTYGWCGCWLLALGCWPRICRITLSVKSRPKTAPKPKIQTICFCISSCFLYLYLCTSTGNRWQSFSIRRNYFKVLLLLINSIKRFINFYFLISLPAAALAGFSFNGKTLPTDFQQPKRV